LENPALRGSFQVTQSLFAGLQIILPGEIDDIPGAYRDIDELMANQTVLVEVAHTLKQVLCVKG